MINRKRPTHSQFTKKYYCIECNKEITLGSKLGRCKSCAQKERLKIPGNNPSFIHGLSNTEEYKQKILRKFVLKKYNLTPEKYQKLLKQQNGLCAICKQPELNKKRNGLVKNLTIDHNHKTGEIRGLLCYHCNLVLGHIYDKISILKTMIEYLQK